MIGKTGTARAASRTQDTSWFAAITNPDNDPALPQYVVVAMVEQGGFGANVAAPIVRRVIDFLNNPLPAARRRRHRAGHRPRAEQLMSTISPSRIARAQQRRGLGEPSRLEASPLRHFDWLLVGAALAITAIGLVMIYSTTHQRIPGDPYYFVKRQALFAGIGLAAMVVVLLIDYRRLRDYSMVFYGVTVFLLVAVLAPVGSNIKGHQAWFQLPGGFTLQPSELAKFGIIVALAGYCNHYRGELDAWRLTVIIGLAARADRPRAAPARPRDRDGARGDHRGASSRWPA